MNIAINGLGRIGRATLKILLDLSQENKEINVVAINDIANIDNLVYLLKYDTVYGIYQKTVSHNGEEITVDDNNIQFFSEMDPANLPWDELNVDCVIDCTGKFLDTNSAIKHITAGAKNVVLSAPAKDDEIATSVIGVNHTNTTQKIISNASCTTNSVAPILNVLDKEFGIKKAMLTTVHAYTASQQLIDTSTKKTDYRKARAGALNIIPTSTGAAIATTKTLPQLKNKFDGVAVRVPVIAGSLSDITFVTKKQVDKKQINEAIYNAAKMPRYNKIIGYTTDQIVSSDILGTTFSCILDATMTRVVDGDLVKIMCWYDNEWGYSSRLAESAIHQCSLNI